MAFSLKGTADLLARAPTALFPIALGLAGLGASLRVAATVHTVELPGRIGMGLVYVAAFVLAVDTLLYLWKVMLNRSAVAADLSTAGRANLLAPGFMAGMVIGGVLAPASSVGAPLWLVATVGHLLLLLRFVGQWLTRDYTPDELNPTWFLPAAGIMTSALSWPGIGPIALPLFTLATGATLWLMLLPLVFRRLVFEPAIDPRVRPSLFIIAAPFGLVANSLLTLWPDGDPAIAGAIACGGVFFILVLLTQARFLMAAGVSLSWWATTFPVATVSAALLRVAPDVGAPALYLGTALLALACLTTTLAIVATVRSSRRTCVHTIDETRDDIAAMQSGR